MASVAVIRKLTGDLAILRPADQSLAAIIAAPPCWRATCLMATTRWRTGIFTFLDVS